MGHWADQSGNGRNFTDGSTTARRPALQNSVINGHPVIRFNGSTHFFVGPSLDALTAGEVFIVIKIDADPPSGTATGLWDFGDSGDATHYTFTEGTIYDDFGTTARKATVNPTPSLSSAFRLYNVVTASGEWTSFLDGTQLFTTATNTVGFPNTTRLGADNGDGAYLDGDIAELVIYSAKLSAGDKSDAEAYFADRYALTIA